MYTLKCEKRRSDSSAQHEISKSVELYGNTEYNIVCRLVSMENAIVFVGFSFNSWIRSKLSFVGVHLHLVCSATSRATTSKINGQVFSVCAGKM